MNESISLLKSALDNIHEAVYILDKHGNFIYVNRAYCEIVGADFDTIRQFSVHDLLRLGYVSYCIYDEVCKSKSEVTVFQEAFLPKSAPTRNGEDRTFCFLITSTPIFDAQGEIEYIVSIEFQVADLNEKYRVASQNQILRLRKLPHLKNPEAEKIIAHSSAFQKVLTLAKMISDSDASVLLQGETGSGKDFLANYIHDIGNRSSGPFVAVNCASVPKDLLEAELFGYVPGAFTGANPKGKIGLIESADGGTLFLDEVNSMPLELQGKLLRLLETKKVTRVGDVKSKSVNFRVLAATNQDLMHCVENGTFRRDLYYRLNVIPITVPPLRERKEDIAPLILHYLNYYSTKYKRVKHLSPQVIERLAEYSWPGNVRELKNLVERLVVVSAPSAMEIQEISSSILHKSSEETVSIQLRENGEKTSLFNFPTPFYYDETRSLKENMEEYELQIIRTAIQKHGSLSKAATALGSSKATLSRKLSQK